MTARSLHAGVRDPGPGRPGPSPFNWGIVSATAAAIGVVVTVVVHIVGLASWSARAETRIAHLEQSVPPGAIATLQERSLNAEKALERIQDRLDIPRPQP